jgi:hypothetical protein
MTENQREAWRKALAAKARQQRQQRYGPRARGVRIIRGRAFTSAAFRPGMARITPPAHDDGVDASTPRCTFPGCPVRCRAGDDRPCAEHDNAPDTTMLDSIWMAQIVEEQTSIGDHEDGVAYHLPPSA